jgi:hypothetical protein
MDVPADQSTPTSAPPVHPPSEVTSEQPGARRYLRIDHNAPGSGFSATRSYAFDGGCVTARLTAPAASGRQLTNETSSATGFTPASSCAGRSGSAPTGDWSWTRGNHDEPARRAAVAGSRQMKVM